MSHEKKKQPPVLGGAGVSRLRSPDRGPRPDNGELNPQMDDEEGERQNDDHLDELGDSTPSVSSLSSSPPCNFDVNPESQYRPIMDDDIDDDDPDHDYADEDFLPEAMGDANSSLASSLSLEHTETHHHHHHHRDYESSPVIFSTIAPASNKHPAALGAATKSSNSSRVIRCPVCEKPMRTFYCAKCIQTGRFVTLDHNQLTENRFSQTTIECIPTITTNSENENPTAAANAEALATTGTTTTKTTDEEEVLQIKLRALTRRTEALRALYKEQQAKLDQTRRQLEEARQQVELDKRSHRSKESKIELIKRFIASRKASVKKREDAKAECLEDLRQHASRRVYQLTQEVFPLEEVNLFEQQNSSFVNMETSPLLTFSDGSHHQIEQLTAYSIVEPWLPSNGDYSAYSLWVQDNKDQLQAPAVEESSPERSPAFRIGAALAYATQFVRNLANYLDVILPAQMDLDMFSRELLEDAQFSYNVAKLNANVIHLCVAQGIDVSLLNSHRTLKNLSLLFNLNLCDLGRKPIIDLDSVDEVARRIESQLANDLTLVREDFYDFTKLAAYEGGGGGGGYAGQDDDQTGHADDDGASDSEWEISDNISSPVDLQMVEQSQIQQSSYISRPLRLFSSFWTASSN